MTRTSPVGPWTGSACSPRRRCSMVGSSSGRSRARAPTSASPVASASAAATDRLAERTSRPCGSTVVETTSASATGSMRTDSARTIRSSVVVGRGEDRMRARAMTLGSGSASLSATDSLPSQISAWSAITKHRPHCRRRTSVRSGIATENRRPSLSRQPTRFRRSSLSCSSTTIDKG